MALIVAVYVFCSLVSIIWAFVVLYLRWNFNYWRKRRVQGPKPHLLVGTLPKSSAGQCNQVEELHEIYLRYKSMQKYVGIFTARTPKLFICDPQLALEILTQHFKNCHDNESSQWSSEKVEQLRFTSPFVSVGEKWRARRSELVPALTINKIRSFYSAMRDSAQKAVEFLQKVATQPQDAKELANRFTAQFMSNFIWGIEGNAFNVSEKPATARSSLSPVHCMASAMLSQSLEYVHYYGQTAAWPWLRKIRPKRFFPLQSDRFFQQLLTDAMDVRAKQSADGGAVRGDLIDHLQQLRDKKSLNALQITGHTTTVLIDGFETGAMLIAHCLLLLARNTRVQQKLRDELLYTNVADSFDALNELPYLDQCIQVYISSYSFHHDPEYFEKPEEFWPERFAEELGGVRKYRDMGVFLPFGDGPRMCPGMKLGLAEAKVAVAELVRNFQLAPGPNVRNDNRIASDSFLLTIDGSMELEFTRLNQS